MRYEDASHTGAFQGQGPIANDDSDQLAAGAKSTATGNLITGDGTQTGSVGADSATGGHITAIAGKSGEDTSFSGGKLNVLGEYGKLSVDADGNYVYEANKGVENVRDRFTYTLADSNGATDTAALIVEIGKTPFAIKADAQQIVPGPDGVVTLPPGVELSDVHVVGRNLVIDMPDGTQLIIIDGAVFVPQLVLGGVEVPATNVAALLVGQEVQPAAGEITPSSGGNFAVPPPPLDPGVPLGDLIPPTELNYVPPEVREVIPEAEDEDPVIFIQPDGQPAAVNAVDEVNEAGLPTRNGGEPEGSGEEAAAGANGDPSEATAGTIVINSPDGIDSVTITGADGIPHEIVVGLVVQGEFGTLTITGIVGDDFTYSYLLNDNTSGNDTHDDFSVLLTDGDGDQAAATLVIDIIDDVPTARPDTDDVGVGGFLATGNVMTDAAAGDAGDSDNGRDTVGADNAHVTAVSSVNVPANVDTDAGANFQINGQYGALTLNADGSYTYVRNPNSPGGVTDVFNYTITDGDGDTSSTTLTINIPDTPLSIQFGNGVPLDDDVIPGAGGNVPDGPEDDDPDVVGQNVVLGDIDVQGGDGALTFSLQTTGAPAGFTYVAGPGGSLLIQQGGVTVITVTLDPATGAYSVTQNAPIDHPTLNGQVGDDTENNVTFPVTVRVTDADGDFAETTGQIFVDDDSPEMNRADISLPTLHVDETDLGTNDSDDFSVVFDGSFGADGPGTTSYAVSTVNGTDSGLVDVATGDPVLLFNNGGVVEGRAGGPAGPIVFTVSVDSATGVVTLDQVRAVEHPDPTNDDEPVSPDATSIQLTATITDHDGDSDSLTVNIGNSLVMDDDGPTVTANEVSGTVDEDGVPGGIADGPADVAGEDTTATGSVSSLFNSGADQPLTFGFAADAVTVLEALGLTSGGDALDYDIVGNTVTASTAAGDVFSFTLNADGSWEFELLGQLDHPTLNGQAGDDTENDLTISLGAIVEATDADGDSVVGNADGLVITVDDDTPVARNDTDAVPAGGDIATGNVITGVDTTSGPAGADSPGADAPAQIIALAGAVTSDSNPAGGFVAQGNFGTLTMQADGSYSYDRADGAPGNVSDIFTYTYEDADGDKVTATLTININDSAPSLPDPDQIHLDDDVIPGANGNVPDGPGDDNPDVVGQNVVNGQLNGTGGDAPLSYNFTGVNTLPTGFSIGAGSDADTLIIVQDQNGSDITVMTIQLDQSDGSFTVTQNNPILHPTQNGTGSDNTENNLDFSIGVEVEDADGDTDPAAITINVDDDTPTIDVVKGTGAEPELTTDDAQTIGGASDTAQSSANFGGLFSLNQSAGADGAAAAATLAYELGVQSQGVNSGLESHNADIFLYEIGGVVVGSTSATEAGVNAGNTIFDVTVDANGVVTLTQYQQIDHDTADPTPTGPGFADHIVDLADGLVTLTASSSLTDRDGDTVTDSETVNIGANLNFTDDGPNADVSGTAVGTVTLDETRGVGTDTVGGSPPAGDNSATIDFSVNFAAGTFGADGPGTTTYALQLTGTNVASGLFALDNTDMSAGDGDGFGQGGQIVLNQAGNTITGSFNGTPYFTITIDPATGVVTFTQLANIWHPTAGSSAAALDESATLNTLTANLIQVVQTLTDFDGDTDTASIDIGRGVFIIQDDGPRFGPDIDATLNIDNDATPSGTGDLDIVIGTDSPNGGTGNNNPDDLSVSNFTISVNDVAATNVVLTQGAENATTASYTFTFDYPNGDGTTASGTGTLVFNKAAGTYTVELTSGPIEGFSVVSTATGAEPVFYNNEHIGIVEVADGLFMQFTGFSAATGPSPFGNDDVFTGTDDNVHISSTEIGVHGNALQDNEVVDFEFMTSDPGAVDAPPNATASTAFIVLGQFNSSNPEDVILVLKLADPNDPDNFITRTLVVNGDDILDTQGDIPAGFPTLGTNEAMIIIAPEDYINLPGVPDNYEIAGMQIRSSSEGLSSAAGEVYNFDGDVGEVDNTTTSFGGTTNDNDVLKIVNIGAVIETTEDQSATIDFDVTIHDADGDTATQHITVNIGDTTQEPLVVKSASSTAAEDISSSGLVADSYQSSKVAANSNTVTMAAAVAAAGMADSAAAAPAADQLHQVSEPQVAKAYTVDKVAVASDDNSSSMAAQLDTQEADAVPGNSGGHARAYEHRAIDSLDAASNHQSNDDGSAHQVANDQGPAAASADASPVAPTVAMVSAEALAAAGVDGDAKQAGSVKEIIAEALGHGNAHDAVDALLDAFHGGGNGGGPDIANLASPAAGGVSAWDMASNGGSAGAAEMLMKVGATALHHDMVQPTHNG